jgi:hypothetical protein
MTIWAAWPDALHSEAQHRVVQPRETDVVCALAKASVMRAMVMAAHWWCRKLAHPTTKLRDDRPGAGRHERKPHRRKAMADPRQKQCREAKWQQCQCQRVNPAWGGALPLVQSCCRPL